MFSLCLNQTSGGSLDFGVDESKVANGASIEYVPISFDRWYNFNVTDVLVNSTSIGLPPSIYNVFNDALGCFTDSGTSVILMGPVIFNQFQATIQSEYGSLPGIGDGALFNGTCISKSGVDLSEYPVLKVRTATVNGTVLDLETPPTNYMLDLGDCYVLGIGAVSGLGIILGDVFLTGYYTVYDRENLQLGFAPVKPGSCSSSAYW